MSTRTWFSIRAAAADTGEVEIYSDIGPPDGLDAKRFLDDLKALGPVKNLTVRINSCGGCCFTASAVYNQLRRHSAKKTVVIDGVAASAASVIAMAGDVVRMPENSLMMIHRPYALVLGNASDMASMIEALDRIEAGMVLAYQRSGQTDAKIRQLLAAETWMSAAEAVELGFADQVEEPLKVAAHADFSRFPYRHPPQPSPTDQWDRVLAKFPARQAVR